MPLSAEELAELPQGFRTLVAFGRLLRGSRGAETAVSGDSGNDRVIRLSISATDRGPSAGRQRGLPVSQYLIGLVLPDGSGLLPAGVEQRELLDAVRLLRSLLSETGGAAPEGLRFDAAARSGGDAADRTGTTAPQGPLAEGL